MLTILALVALSLAAEPAPAPTDAAPTGTLVVDARLPVEVRVDGQARVQLWTAGKAELPVAPGEHVVTALVGGTPTDVKVTVPQPGRTATLLVGKTGITTREDAPPAAATAGKEVSVELRVTGPGPVQVRLDARRWEIAPGTSVSVTEPAGEHAFSVRSREGTAIWANGSLDLASGAEPVVVQISEGRMPEVSGDASFYGAGG